MRCSTITGALVLGAILSVQGTGLAQTGYSYNKLPQWKKLYDQRQQDQWNKPAGGLFAQPATQPRTTFWGSIASFFSFSSWWQWRRLEEQRRSLKALQEVQTKQMTQQKSQTRLNIMTLLARVSQFWKSLWHRPPALRAQQSPFALDGGFGRNVIRAAPNADNLWYVRGTRPGAHIAPRFQPAPSGR